MAESLHQYFVIKATSKYTGDIHYVKVDDGYIELVDRKIDGSLYENSKDAEIIIKECCEGEETHEYTVSSVMLTEEEVITKH